MRIGVTGISGQLGRDLVNALQKAGFFVVPLSRYELDLSKRVSLPSILDRFKLDCLVNCAAYTSVDGAEFNGNLAMQVNASFLQDLSEYCKIRKIDLIQISTDSVFSSETPRFFETTSCPNPINMYGKSKAAGEKAVLDADLESFKIIRTAWLYGKQAHKFLQAIIEKAARGKPFEVVDDQFGQPTSTLSLAQFIVFLLTSEKQNGIFHFTSSDFTSRADFARKVLSLSGFDQGLIRSVRTKSEPMLAKRPSFSLLDTSVESTGNYQWVYQWEDELKSFLLS